MSRDSDARKLRQVFSVDELAALRWAAEMAASVADSLGDASVGASHDNAVALSRRLRAMGPLLRLATEVDPAVPVGHDCTSCGTSLDACDERIEARKPACCVACSINDTHGDPVDGLARRRRERQRIAELHVERDALGGPRLRAPR